MSAVAQNYVYRVKVDSQKKTAEPTLSKEMLKQYQENVEKYLAKQK